MSSGSTVLCVRRISIVGEVLVRAAVIDDAAAVAELAGELAQSFPLYRPAFDASFDALLADPEACLLVAVPEAGGVPVGYLLGVRHLTFYANGPVAAVEEIMVATPERGQGTGRALMDGFEQWAREHGCALVTLATRRAAAFYQALGYEPSADYLRKVLPD
jgi:GNAT superfamily N-acetyltransferase